MSSTGSNRISVQTVTDDGMEDSGDSKKATMLPQQLRPSKKDETPFDPVPTEDSTEDSTKQQNLNVIPSPIAMHHSTSTSSSIKSTTTLSPLPTPHHQKSVCFHSVTGQPGGSDKKITNAIDCLQYMINGMTLIKVKASMRQYRRFYSLEEDLSMIRWTPSTKKTSKARLAVKSIREVRRGKNTEALKSAEITALYKEECSFSIIYGDDFESIDLIALSSGEANIWVTGLNFLIGLIRSQDSLEGREKMREKWLLDVFDEADADHKGMLDELETIALLKRLNERLCIDSLKQKIVEFEMCKKNGEQRGCISRHAFISLFTQTATRPDIYFLLVRYCGRDYMTVEELQLFLEGEQAITGTSLELCQKLIERFEPSDEARQRKQLLIDGFTQFITSEACYILGYKHKQITQDMDHPFPDYYIAASYNTYLIEDQVKGPSSCEGYSKTLLTGCRCVKIDVHDGPKCTPMVYHGNTLTSKIPLADVLVTIRDNAFISSPYPVIIHLENHCSLIVQKQVAQLFLRILGKHLFLLNHDHDHYYNNHNEQNNGGTIVEGAGDQSIGKQTNEKLNIAETFPLSSGTNNEQLQLVQQPTPQQSWNKLLLADESIGQNNTNVNNIADDILIWSKLTPNKLKNKIIISGKKNSRPRISTDNCDNNSVEEVSDEDEENLHVSHDCGSIGGSSGVGSDGRASRNSGRKTVPLCQELSDLISLCRVKVDQDWDNFDDPNLIHLNESVAFKIIQQNMEEMTQRNKCFLTQCTPDVSRIDSSNLNPLDFWNVGVQLISMNYQTNGQIMNLYRGWFSQNGSCGFVLKPSYLREKHSTFNFRRKDLTSVKDPLNIRIKIISGQQLPRPKGTSQKANSIDPYIIVQCLGMPMDCAENRTCTVSNDGMNPIFDECFEFNVYLPELTMIRFLVLDDEFINDDFIGQLTVPVTCLQSGYKHVKLLDMNDEIIPNASLFVKIALSQRYGSKQRLKRKKSWPHKNSDARPVGVKHLDEQLKNMFTMVYEASNIRKHVEKVILDLCEECSLPESANMAQCLRIITLRLATCPTVLSFKIVQTDLGYPSIKVTGELTQRLNKTICTLDRSLTELYSAIDQSQTYINLLADLYHKLSNIEYQFDNSNTNSTELIDILRNACGFEDVGSENSGYESESCSKKTNDKDSCQNPICSEYADNRMNNDNFPDAASNVCSVHSKHQTVSYSHNHHHHYHRKNHDKNLENLFWNLSLIKAELDNLYNMKNECQSFFSQIERIAESLERTFEREHKIILRSNSNVARELCNVNNLMTYQSSIDVSDLSSKPTMAINASGDGPLRSILKKSTSPNTSQEQTTLIDSSQKYFDYI